METEQSMCCSQQRETIRYHCLRQKLSRILACALYNRVNRARPTPLKCRNEYLVLALEEETAVQAVVDSIFWAFCRLKKPRCQEMSARGYALHSVCPQLSFVRDLLWSCEDAVYSVIRCQVVGTL